jgi:hypothetical protein
VFHLGSASELALGNHGWKWLWLDALSHNAYGHPHEFAQEKQKKLVKLVVIGGIVTSLVDHRLMDSEALSSAESRLRRSSNSLSSK